MIRLLPKSGKFYTEHSFITKVSILACLPFFLNIMDTHKLLQNITSVHGIFKVHFIPAMTKHKAGYGRGNVLHLTYRLSVPTILA